MITGEFKKVLRNRVFWVITVAVIAANIVCVLYNAEAKNDVYYDYKDQELTQYIESYDSYINEMGNRGEMLLTTLDTNDKRSEFLKKNVEKTERDYSGLNDIKLDTKYNVGVEEYSGYDYGIFFCIIFAFVCLEYVYLFEKQNGSINILRSTKKGRWQMILSKWCVYLLLVLAFAVLQELINIGLYAKIYSLGNLSSAIQSLPIFRDCPNELSMLKGITAVIFNRLMISVTAACIIFFFGIALNGVIKAITLPCVIFVIEYIFSITISINSSQDKLCCMNLFYLWSMEKYIGVYHNLDFFGIPIEKNTAAFVMNCFIIICAIIVGTLIFSVRYQTGGRKYEFKILTFLRKQLSKILHIKSIFLNELYKLLLQQKKAVLFIILALVVIGSVDYYIPKNLYQTAEEATYHMYLSHIQGPLNAESEQFITDEENYIKSLEEKLAQASESGDESALMTLGMELDYRQKAFERLSAQYEKLLQSTETKKYLVDEINLKNLWDKYDRDVLLFILSTVILTLTLSGLYASEKELKISRLIYASKYGREKLLSSKIQCSIFITAFIFIFTQLPSIIGYCQILKPECLAQKLNLFYDPEMKSALTLLAAIAIMYLIKLILYAFIALLTIIMARKTKNEFVTSVFICTVIIIASLVMYFLKSNISLLVISLL